MTEHFGPYSAYYDLLYQDKDYAAEVGYLKSLLKRYGHGIRTILEFGTGTGRHAELLAREGYDILGVELSPLMCEQATVRAAGLSQESVPGRFEAQNGDARTFETERRFDAAIAMFHVVSYLTTNDDVTRMFANTARHLRNGGLFVFDVWYGPAVLALRPETRVKRMQNASIEVVRIAEPEVDFNANVVDVNYSILVKDRQSATVNEFSERHPMRYYFRPEIEMIAKRSGFAIVDSAEWMTAAKPGPETWGVCFVGQKNE